MRKLLVRCSETKLLTPRRFLEAMLERMRQEHEAAGYDGPFMRPGYPRLAKVLTEAGYATPKGRPLVARASAAAYGRSIRSLQRAASSPSP